MNVLFLQNTNEYVEIASVFKEPVTKDLAKIS